MLLLVLPLLSPLCHAEDPFAMFEFEEAPRRATTPDCCEEAGRCRRLLDAFGPLRARWTARPRCPARSAVTPAPPPPVVSRRQADSAFMRRHVKRTLQLLRLDDADVPPAERETFQLRGRITEQQVRS